MSSIYHRVSIRKFEDRPVEEELLREVIRSGMQAPSAGNQQPWEFYVVTDPEKIQALSQVSPYAGCAARARVVIVPAMRLSGLKFPPYAQIDMAICQENMWLRADELGLGGVWLGIAPQKERMEAVRKVLDLPDHLEAFSIFALGYPAEEKVQQDRFEEERIHFV